MEDVEDKGGRGRKGGWMEEEEEGDVCVPVVDQWEEEAARRDNKSHIDASVFNALNMVCLLGLCIGVCVCVCVCARVRACVCVCISPYLFYC